MKAIDPTPIFELMEQRRRGHYLVVDDNLCKAINSILKETHDLPHYRIKNIDKYIAIAEEKIKECKDYETLICSLTAVQLADILQISRPTLQKWREAGIIHFRSTAQSIRAFKRKFPHLNPYVDKRPRKTSREVSSYNLDEVLEDLIRYRNFTSCKSNLIHI